MKMAKYLALIYIVNLCSGFTPSIPEITWKFNWINFTFESVPDYQAYMEGGYELCMPAGIKLNSKQEIFISIPRWHGGVPATLNKLVSVTNNVALFSPFPSFEGNLIGSPTALQSVLGFEIDLEDNIWVLDQGRINNTAALPFSMKVIQYSPSGAILKNFDLSSVTFPETSFLNDIVLDANGGFLYITDSGTPITPGVTTRPGLIVININTNSITRVLDSDPSTMPDPSLWVTINGEHVVAESPMETGADGIALSCDKRTLYYTPLTSRELYAIDTAALQANAANISQEIVKLGYKYSASDGLMCSQNGHMYLTAIELNGVLMQSDITPTPENFQFNVFSIVMQNNTYLIWPDTLGFDNTGKRLYAMTNQLQNFVQYKINFLQPNNGDANFYIWSIYVNDKSYLEDCIYSTPSSEDNSFPVWAIVLVVIVAVVVVVIAGCAIQNFRQARKKRQTFL